MRESVQGKPSPTKVGLYETDSSPYGVRDVAGTITQWSSSLWPGTTTDYRVMGAAFNSMDILCELNKEIRAPGNIGMLHTGFRVVLELKPEDFLPSE
jgi:formylglycine-generating enzyme required for sulfatase activity